MKSHGRKKEERNGGGKDIWVGSRGGEVVAYRDWITGKEVVA